MSTQRTLEDGTAVFPLSPLDAIMGNIGFTVVYVFPPPAPAAADAACYDLDRVHAALISTIEQDYPVFIGELQMDPTIGSFHVLQTPACRNNGANGIRFFRDATCSLTTEEAVTQTPLSLLPPREKPRELLTVKASLLSDGGLAIGMNMAHVLLDGEGMFTFFNVWGMHYRGVPKSQRPVISHDRHQVFPRGTGPTMPHPEFSQPKPPVATGESTATTAPVALPPAPPPVAFPPTTQKPFHLSPQQLTKLKAIAMEGIPEGHYLSTIDVVTALFTLLITQARGHGSDINITTGVNARTRFTPPLPSHYAGNVIFNALSAHEKLTFAQPVTASSLQQIAWKIRSSILERTDFFLRDAIEYITEENGKWSDKSPSVEFFFGKDLMFTSWANMGMYDADFGHGKPWYTGPPLLPVCDGMAIIMDGIHGQTGLDVLPLLACTTMDKLTQLWQETCEALQL